MKNIFTLLISCTYFNFIYSQPAVEWQGVYGGNNDDFAMSMQLTEDGGAIIVGNCNSSNSGDVSGVHGYTDWWVVKVSSIGVIQWSRAIGGMLSDIQPIILQTPDGGYAVIGHSESNNGDMGMGYGAWDIWLFKLTSDGNILWKKNIGGSLSESVQAIKNTQDGGFIVIGNTNSTNFDAAGNHGKSDMLVVKINSQGAKEWSKVLGGSEHDYVKSVVQTTDEGYLIAGNTSSSNGDISGYHGGSTDCWVAKLSSFGDLSWSKTLGGSKIDEVYSAIQTSDGGYIVGGNSNSTDGDVTGNHGNQDYWVVKLTNEGNIAWQKTYGGSELDAWDTNGLGQLIMEVTPKGYLVGGRTKSNNGDVTGFHGNDDYWLVQIDTIGNIQWQRALGGSQNDEIHDIKQLSNGSYILVGTSYSSDGDVPSNKGFQDLWIVRLNKEGAVMWTKTMGGSAYDNGYFVGITPEEGYIFGARTSSNDGDIVGQHGELGDYWLVKMSSDIVSTISLDSLDQYKQLDLFPNPSNGTIVVKVSSEYSDLNVCIVNLLGMHVKTNEIHNGSTIDISELPTGIYYVIVKTPEGKTYAKKISKHD